MNTSSGRLQCDQAASTVCGAPVFVLGVWKRSGTNFVADLLALHPSFQLPRPLWEDALLRSSQHLEYYVDSRIAAWTYWIEQDGSDPEKLRKEFLGHVGAGVLSFMASRIDSGARLLCKTPYTDHIDRFPRLFPQAKLVLLVRDGRDVVESAKRTWSKQSYRFYMRKWAMGARQLLDFVRSSGQDVRDQWIIVRYEDILRNPATLQELIRFVGIPEQEYPWDRVENLAVRGSSENRGADRHVHWQPTIKPSGFQPVGRWQSWGRWRRAQFKRIAGRELIELGYVDSNDW